MSQAALAQILGVTTATVRAWTSRGCPVVEACSKGKPARYNTAAVARWREEQIALASSDNSAVDFDEARRRRMVALAVIAEVEADMKAGAVVLIDDVISGMRSELAIVRNQLLGLGSRIAPRAAVLRTPEEVKALIDAEVYQTLENLTMDRKSPDDVVATFANKAC